MYCIDLSLYFYENNHPLIDCSRTARTTLDVFVYDDDVWLNSTGLAADESLYVESSQQTEGA